MQINVLIARFCGGGHTTALCKYTSEMGPPVVKAYISMGKYTNTLVRSV